MAKQNKPELTPEIITKAKKGDTKATNQLLAWTTNFVRSKVHVSKQRTHDRRSDVAQDVAMKVIANLESFEGTDPVHFEKWVFVIARRATAQSIRDAGADKRDIKKQLNVGEEATNTHSDSRNSPSQQFADMEMSRIAMGILLDSEHMPEDQREVIILRTIRQVRVADIARRMGQSEAWVDSTFRRAMAKLRTLYAAEVGEMVTKTNLSGRSKRAAAFIAFLRRLEAGKPVDIDTFLREVESDDKELRAILELIEDLRRSGFEDDSEDDEET